MKYEEFTEVFLNRLESEMEQDNITLHRNTVTKENQTLDAVTVQFGNSPIAPVVYLRDKYELYETGFSIVDIAEVTAKSMREAKNNAPEIPELTREAAMKNLYCAVINAKENELLLRQIPYEMTAGDLAVIAKYRIDENASFVVRNNLCSCLHMTPSEIMGYAHKNTDKMKFTCRNINDILGSMLGNDISEEMDYVEHPEAAERPQQMTPASGMFVLSNTENYDGAVAITSTKFLDEVYTMFGESFYILPSSRHELIAIPKSIAPDEEQLRQMIIEVNETQVDTADRLSDHPYKYSGISRRVEMAGIEETHEIKHTTSKTR